MKNRFIAFFTGVFVMISFYTQTGWTWAELDSMPVKISNNAVVEGFIGSTPYVYSFAGIDSTKSHEGINLSAYRYDVSANLWETLPPLPDTMGKIACGVSRIGEKLYIMGGYHVLSNGDEISSDKVHIFNVSTNTYETNGTNIPVPIDDHVQCVYKDSLIYIITGWSNTNNVADVQIYDPALDQWLVGTPTPNDNYYKAFGASGVIIGDTIFYNGGVRSGFNFATVNFTRKGIINPNDPTQITWSQISDNPGAAGYRMACSHYEGKAFWIGGGGVAYNYNGMAYYGGGGVEPLERILQFDAGTYLWDEGLGTPFQIMDLRGIARISDTDWIVCGGMQSNQEVSNSTFLITYDPVVGSVEESDWQHLLINPNPVSDILYFDLLPEMSGYQITDLSGKLIQKGFATQQIDVSQLPEGFYLLLMTGGGQYYRSKFEKN